MKRVGLVAFCLLVGCATTTSVRVEKPPLESISGCAEQLGDMRFCDQEPYRTTCGLLRAVTMAICESDEVSSNVSLLVFIPEDDPRSVVILASLDREHHRAWLVHSQLINATYPHLSRTLTDDEIRKVSQLAAAMVAEETAEWVP